ncbi:MAG: ATP-dependent 6-phosphofructokinase, partial [Myxococcota bacterium]
RGGTILGTTNRGKPFGYPVKQADGSIVYEDRSELLLQRLHDLGIDAVVMIGGDGSMAIAQQLREMGVNVVGVPKTIDNDLSVTDYTFGFDTACNIAMEALDRLHTTAYSHDRAMFVEVMGRHAGWIALHAGLAAGADVILMPEIPYRVDSVVTKIRERQAHGITFSIIVVAEGAVPRDGEISMVQDKYTARQRLGGAAHRIADAVCDQIDLEVRVTVLGHIQRGGTPSHFDRVLGTRFGHAAAQLVASGQFGRMVTLHGLEIDHCDIREAIDKPNLVDPEGQMVQAARALDVCVGD